ncbi:MAG: hypothetical protein LUQ59_07780 [Methanothrix sp.]|nr:hypothetical protein [Methanothrix sp.]
MHRLQPPESDTLLRTHRRQPLEASPQHARQVGSSAMIKCAEGHFAGEAYFGSARKRVIYRTQQVLLRGLRGAVDGDASARPLSGRVGRADKVVEMNRGRERFVAALSALHTKECFEIEATSGVKERLQFLKR